MRLILWTKTWWKKRKIRREADSLQNQIRRFSKELESTEKLRKRSLKNLTRRRKELDSIRDSVVEVEERLRETVDEAQRLHRQYKDQLEAAQSKLKIMEEVTLPTLIQQNQKIIEMWKYETSVHIMKQIANQDTDQESSDGY